MTVDMWIALGVGFLFGTSFGILFTGLIVLAGYQDEEVME